jgi:methyl-accepting chemotaxis protein
MFWTLFEGQEWKKLLLKLGAVNPIKKKMKLLSFINLAGVLALGVLSISQWSENRQLNQEINRLEAIRIDNAKKLDERDHTISGNLEDIETLRNQILSLTDLLKTTEGELNTEEKLNARLTAESEQLKASIEKWAKAVEIRDQRIAEDHSKIKDLAEHLGDVVERHNDLAASYNDVAKVLNERTKQYNELIQQFNELQSKK